MSAFTLVMAYYENAGMLREQLAHFRKLPEDIAGRLHVRIVDDGSPENPAANVCIGLRAVSYGIPPGPGVLASFELWRMGVDVRWNQDACRNVGVRQAASRWVLLTDMDHMVPEKTWRHLMFEKLKKDRAYRFARVNAPKGDAYKPHPNTWAMTRDLYWIAGGYDEALAGHYGTDGDFKVRLSRVTQIEDLTQPVIRYPREVIADASTTTLERKSQADRDWINATIKARARDPKWRPLHFSFPCVRVL